MKKYSEQDMETFLGVFLGTLILCTPIIADISGWAGVASGILIGIIGVAVILGKYISWIRSCDTASGEHAFAKGCNGKYCQVCGISTASTIFHF